MEDYLNNAVDYGQVFGSLIGITIGILAVLIVLIVLMLVCNWKIYKKMGEPGWKALVPFYNAWVLYEKVWENGAISLAVIIPSILSSSSENALFASALSLTASIIGAITNWKLYKRFGKSDEFCVLGLFFPVITHAICAFDDSVFDADCNDPEGNDFHFND